MGKKKRGGPTLDQVMERPWCYYCERDFDDMAVLINHQKAKHFKCDRCNRRLNTAGGLSVHMDQVHKVELKQVENSLENRKIPNIEIFGMEGIPDDVAEQHRQRVIAHYHEVQVEHQKRTGNPPAGAQGANPAKKIKTESASELKQRLAEFRAKKAAGGTSQSGGSAAQSPPDTAGSPMQTGQTPGAAHFPGQAGSPPPGYQHGHGQLGYPPPGQHQAPPTYNAPPPQPLGPGMPPYGQPPHPQQYPYPGSPPPPMPYRAAQNNSTSPPQNASMYGAPPRPGFAQGPPGYPQHPAVGAAAGSPYQAAPGQSFQPPGTGSFGLNFQSTVTRAPSLKGTPLPSRPLSPRSFPYAVQKLAPNATTVNDTKSGQAPETPTADDKKKDSKKKKEERATKLLYSDNNVSPEEKMAKMSKYYFDPAKRGEQVALGSTLDAPRVAGAGNTIQA